MKGGPQPFGRHESRWMSAGVPTSLVHNDGVEFHDNILWMIDQPFEPAR